MVEAAVILALFMTLVLGTIEVAQLGMTSQLLTGAVNKGCRVAVIDGKSQNDVRSTVANLLSSGGIRSSSYTLVTTPSDVATSHTGDPVTVTIAVPFRSVSWLGVPLFLGAPTLRSSSTLSSERP